MVRSQKWVVYYRVSTAKQEKSGLGLDAQRLAVEAFVAEHGGTIVGEHMEVESRSRQDRPQLINAIAHTRRCKGSLLVAKLDRLLAGLPILVALRDAKVPFKACDDPHADEFTVDLKAIMAEEELRKVSARTKAALAAAKQRGAKLGSHRPGHWRGREHLRSEGQKRATVAAAQANRRAFVDEYADLFQLVSELRHGGMTLQGIADDLNGRGYETRRGKAWNPTQVMRLLRHTN
jgi:DNA invertase Pin-like site-specific DNA recombinase